MMGKSSTANSLFNEPVAQVTSYQQDTAQPQLIKRSAAGFEMSVIDTQGLMDSDCVSTSVRQAFHHPALLGCCVTTCTTCNVAVTSGTPLAQQAAMAQLMVVILVSNGVWNAHAGACWGSGQSFRLLHCLQALRSIGAFLKDKPVDVVLYLDRLDLYRVEKTDQEMMAAITNSLGPQIWKNTIIGLTHGKAIPPQGFFSDKQGKYPFVSLRFTGWTKQCMLWL